MQRKGDDLVQGGMATHGSSVVKLGRALSKRPSGGCWIFAFP